MDDERGATYRRCPSISRLANPCRFMRLHQIFRRDKFCVKIGDSMAAEALHHFIEKYNILQKPTEQISAFFQENPTFYKAALIANHIFRALAMATFCAMLPFSAPINFMICFAGSLFYRLTVETNCAYKFALPAFAGSIAIPMGVVALTNIVTGIALVSLQALGLALISLIPLAAYATYVILTVNYDVDNR